MFEALAFPASGLERMDLIRRAHAADIGGHLKFDDMGDDQKLAYVLGMQAGYYQGKREMAQAVARNLTMAAIGFMP